MIEHAMFDCETLGVGDSPVLLSIACAIFTETAITDRFHYHVYMGDPEVQKLEFSGSTILWWMGQSQEAREAIIKGQDKAISLFNVLLRLDRLFTEHKLETVWSYGATADLTWLKSAYKAVEMFEPWTYKQERCLRTIGGTFDPKGTLRPRPTVEHDALADAESQVEWLLRMGARHDFPIR